MISVVSISPLKNSTGVHVNTDIEIVLSAQYPLDPRNVSFSLNEVDVVPNCFSVYNGANDHELIITLYTKKRIKYQTDRRYGQEGVRYGQRDDFPSILEYGQRYVCQFTAWATDLNGEKQTVTDRFVFNTEEGIFENERPPEYYYSDMTQSLANYFPEWSKTRYDKFSNTQQLLNPIGVYLEKMNNFVDKQKNNNFIQTTDLNQLSWMTRVELSKDFEIKSVLNEDGSFFYIQPEISAIHGISRFDLFTSQNNDLDSFFHSKLPTRIDTEKSMIGDNLFFGPEVASETKIEIDKELLRPGSFCIRVSGLSSSIHRTDQDTVVFSKCRILGESFFGKKQEEDILLLDDRDLFVKKLWKKIDSIQFFNLKKQNIIFTIKYFKDRMSETEDKFRTVTADDNDEKVFWSGENRGNRTILKKNISIGENAADVLRNSGRTITIQETELLDINNSSSLSLIDVVPSLYENKIYGIDNNYLYIFNKGEEYPEVLKGIPGDNGLSDFVLELDSDEMSLDEDGQKEINIKCIHRTPGRTIVRYRLRIKKPDGTQEFVDSLGNLTLDKTKATIFTNQLDILLPEVSYSFTLDQVGDYLVELETVYRGGFSSKDVKLVRILKSSALIKYKLERILDGDSPKILLLDQDQRLKILTESGILHSLILRKDGVLIDYENKILYFSEDYSSVDVS